MNREAILAFLNANPGCHLATVEGDQPRVRGMFMYRADEHGIIFHTGAFKSLYSQLRGNKKVEICLNSPDTQVRIAGAVEVLYDAPLKKVEAFDGAERRRRAGCISDNQLQGCCLDDGSHLRADNLCEFIGDHHYESNAATERRAQRRQADALYFG